LIAGDPAAGGAAIKKMRIASRIKCTPGAEWFEKIGLSAIFSKKYSQRSLCVRAKRAREKCQYNYETVNNY
jgi:hypothetical protein